MACDSASRKGTGSLRPGRYVSSADATGLNIVAGSADAALVDVAAGTTVGLDFIVGSLGALALGTLVGRATVAGVTAEHPMSMHRPSIVRTIFMRTSMTAILQEGGRWRKQNPSVGKFPFRQEPQRRKAIVP